MSPEVEGILPAWVRDVREVHTGLKGMRRHVSGEESLSISSGNRITEYRKLTVKGFKITMI